MKNWRILVGGFTDVRGWGEIEMFSEYIVLDSTQKTAETIVSNLSQEPIKEIEQIDYQSDDRVKEFEAEVALQQFGELHTFNLPIKLHSGEQNYVNPDSFAAVSLNKYIQIHIYESQYNELYLKQKHYERLSTAFHKTIPSFRSSF